MKLSAYTIAKNCTDKSDCNEGIKEIYEYLENCRKKNIQPAKTAFIRLNNLYEKEHKLKK